MGEKGSETRAKSEWRGAIEEKLNTSENDLQFSLEKSFDYKATAPVKNWYL